MSEIAEFPYFQLQFDKQGKIFQQDELDELLTKIADQKITDLLFISHGWKNDIADATQLYTRLISNIRNVLNEHPEIKFPDRKLAFVGVFWPSKKYTAVELQAGGGASLGGVITEENIRDELTSLIELSDAEDAKLLIQKASDLIDELEDRKSSQDAFIDLIRELMADNEDDEEIDDEMPAAVTTLPGRELIDQLSRPGLLESAAGEGGAAGIGDFFGGIKGGVMNFLNLTTYWKMKKRAGKVGQNGMFEVLQQIKQKHADLKIHMVGHSFGGRLVTAACKGQEDQQFVSVNSLCLLQAAFSHNGFAENFRDQQDGFFRSVVTQQRVTGPVVITHTKNDNAVGLAYPLASRISGEDAAAMGDENDRFGGMGRNGAQHTPEAINQSLLSPQESYQFEAASYYNLQADEFISGHSDVANLAVANLVVNAVATE